ncbi:hypothetical protein EYC80_005884 [Monilinia laxa]|uniref:Uncharacterized protein n=1 Tax=Monilinia laxa TaxID=61186 RepID=A0A5N6KFC4_MONLA|nr:hypothetical protein EYC80_005884 [Monilinia laxa]
MALGGVFQGVDLMGKRGRGSKIFPVHSRGLSYNDWGMDIHHQQQQHHQQHHHRQDGTLMRFKEAANLGCN